jgi:hypothetical protein
VAYRADIEIGVKGTEKLRELRSTIESLSAQINKLDELANTFQAPIQSVLNYTKSVQLATAALDKAELGSQDEADAVKAAARALTEENTVRQRKIFLLDTEIRKQQGLLRAAPTTGTFELGPGGPGFSGGFTAGQRQLANEQAILRTNELQNKVRREKLQIITREELFELKLQKINERNAALEENRKKARTTTENVAIGGAFPLLFGGGPGAVLGGAAGGFIPGNPILSVVTSALGTQLDTLIQSTVDFSKSLREGGDAAGFLEQKLGFLDPTIKKQIQNLQNSGQTAEAAKVAFNKLASEIGKEGAAGFLQAGKNAENLQNSFTKLTLSIVAAGFAFNKFLEDQKAFKFDVNTLPGPFRPTQIPEDAATTAAYKQKTKEIQNQNTLLGLQATLKGIDSKIDLDSYAAIRRKVAQQEYSNELLKIGNQLKLGEIGLDQNQLLIRSANLELAGKIKDIELDRARQLAQNNEQAAQKAKQAADEESRVLKSVASIRKDTVNTILDGVNAQFKLDTLYKGEYVVLKDRIKNAQNELDTKTLILDLEEEAALAGAKDAREQAAIVKLFDQKAKLLQTQASIENVIRSNRAAELKYAKDSLALQQQGSVKQAASGALLDITQAQGALSIAKGGTGFEQAQTELAIQQNLQLDQLANRLKTIDLLKQQAKATVGEEANVLNARIATETALYNIENERLNILFALQEEQLKLNQVTEQYGTIANAVGTAFGTSFKGIIDGSMTAREALSSFFQSVADAFLDMAAQIIQKWIAMTILNSILSIFPGGGGSKGTTSLGNANLIDVNKYSIPLPGLATGGPAMANTPYIVGERGPELFMPGRSGTVIPNDALGGGGTTNVVVNVDASGNSNVQGDQQQAKQLGVAVSAAVQAELVKQQRPGGLLAGTRR